MKPITIEICYENENYIWVEGKGVLDRDLNKVEKEKTDLILEYVKKQGLILDKKKRGIEIDFNR